MTRPSSATAGHINNANSAAVTCRLPYGIGNREITGDFAVGAGWTKNLTAEFDSYNGANPKLLSAGKTLTMKRAIQAAGYSSKVRSINRNGRSGRGIEVLTRSEGVGGAIIDGYGPVRCCSRWS
jgi:hypothetical protein